MTIDYSGIKQEMDVDTQKLLSEAAYYNWLNAGCPDGRSTEFWCEAERQIFGYTSDEWYEEVESSYHSDWQIENA